MTYEKVKWADDCPPCECCGEPWCETHQEHYADCECIGPTEDDVEYDEREDGLYGRRLSEGDCE